MAYVFYALLTMAMLIASSCEKTENCECIEYTQDNVCFESENCWPYYMTRAVECQEPTAPALNDGGRLTYIECN